MTNRISKIIANRQRLIINEQSVSINRTRTDEQLEYTRQSRDESKFGTTSYDKSLIRAFSRLKQQIFFNPDMNQFITLTYRQEDNTVDQVLYDIKQFIKKEKREREASCHEAKKRKQTIKYAFIMEYQKRGSIHVHMIASNAFQTFINDNGHLSLKNWTHGFSSVLTVKDFDINFKPYLYLFKYMKKSQRIGKSFVHTSRNLNNFKELSVDEFDHTLYSLFMTESHEVLLPDTEMVIHYKKHYYKGVE